MKAIITQAVKFDKKAYRQAIRAVKKQKSRVFASKGKARITHKVGRVLAAMGIVIVAAALVFGATIRPDAERLEALLSEGVFAQGVEVDGVDISALSLEQAKINLYDAENKRLQNIKITFVFNNETYTKTAAQLGVSTNIDDVLEQAMWVDKKDALLINLKTRADLKRDGGVFRTTLMAEASEVAQATSLFLEEFYTAPVEPTMVFDKNTDSEEYIYWEEGTDGTALDEQDLCEKILDNVPVGAFDLGTIGAVVTAPQNTTEALSNSVVLIAEYTTSFYGATLSEEKRVANIEKMAALINGSVIEPGEEWSFNNNSGERNAQNGWQLANTLYGGVLVEEMGGGVCQVSSTVYNAFLLAELGIIERHAHSKPSSYVPTGLDATVDYGVKDLKVVNTLEGTIYLVVKVDKVQKKITALIYGPKSTHDYQVIVRALIWQSNIAPVEEAETIVATDGYAPDGTYVAPGSIYAYPKTTYGSRYKTYRYYYLKSYDDETDNPYSWVGYEKGDNASGEKKAVTYYTEAGDGKDIVTFYPPLAGTYYINPEDAN